MSAPTLHRVSFEGARLTGWAAFHNEFSEKLGFPDYYGRNRDAWEDCLYNLSEESTALRLSEGDVLLIEIIGFQDLKLRQPDIAGFLLEGSACVNSMLDEARKDGQLEGRLGVIAICASDSVHRSSLSAEGLREPEIAFEHEVEMSPYDPRAEALARQRGMSEAEIAMIKVGLEDVKAGRTVPHDELMARIAAKHGW